MAFGATWTAEWAFTVALGVVAFRDGGATAVGVVAFVRMAPAALLAPFGTALADRFRRDRVLMWSCFIRAAAVAAAAALLAGGSTVPVYALAVVATAAFTVFRPGHSALLPALCNTPLELTSANVVRGLLDSLSTLLGPLLAALLLDVGSAEAVFALAAALSFGSGLLLLGLSYEAPPRSPSHPLWRIPHETVEGFRALVRYRDAGLLIGLALAASLTRGFLNVFVVVIALELLGMGAPGVGVLTAAVGAGAVAGSLGASALVSGRRLAALEGVGVALWGLPLALSGALPHEPVVLVLMGVIGVGNALADIGLHTLPSRLVPEALVARVFGAKESLTAMSVALGSLISPPVIDLLGVRGALAALGLVAPALAALAWRRLRAIDSSIAHRDAEIAVLQRVGMLRPLPMPAIENLAVHVGHARFATGQAVFHQGDHGDRFYLIEDGEADVIGDGRLIRTMGAGDGFGEIALLRDTVRTTTVRARTPLLLCTLDRHHFVAAVTDYSSSANEAEALMLGRLGTFEPRGGQGA
ncbi:MAG TPA: cyclic nucleotide-binding domain-containing protein [Thermoleophilaceae bacterium]|nr:cyclic nucleotide-binding domain-containing protein [Thermoleophilaceae bacterium]